MAIWAKSQYLFHSHPNMDRIVIAGFTFADFGSASIDQYYSIVMFVIACDVLMFPY